MERNTKGKTRERNRVKVGKETERGKVDEEKEEERGRNSKEIKEEIIQGFGKMINRGNKGRKRDKKSQMK